MEVALSRLFARLNEPLNDVMEQSGVSVSYGYAVIEKEVRIDANHNHRLI